MEIVYMNTTNLKHIQQRATPCVLALGFFDGIHKGHQAVIEAAKIEAIRLHVPLAVMSFRPHPKTVLSNGKIQVGQLTTRLAKESTLEEMGVDLFYVVEFTKEFSQLSTMDFIEEYIVKLKVRHATAGFDFRFGKMGAGTLKDIEKLIPITEVACVHYQGEKISSTAIRQRLETGKVDEIPEFLGRAYTTEAVYHKGRFHLIEDTMLPKDGQYSVLLNNTLESDMIVENGIIRPASGLIVRAIHLHIVWQYTVEENKQKYA